MSHTKKCFLYLFAGLFLISGSLFPLSAADEKEKKEAVKQEKKEPLKLPAVPVPVPDSRKALAEDPLPYEDIAFFFRTLEMIRNAYVDEDKVTTKDLLQKALRGLVRELDPFSAYISEEQASHLEEDTKGSFAGIGVTIAGRGHTVEIINVFDGSPAEKAGVRTGDFLLSVDGKGVSGLNIDECVKLIKGENGSLVRLQIIRKGEKAPLDLTVRRGNVKINTVINQALLRNAYGYLRITQFSATTAEDLAKAVEGFRKRNIKGLVIDLRNNPGGLLISAIGTGSIFLETGREIVSTSGRLPDSKRSFRSQDVPKAPDWPVVILINGNSASAAEIFAGALRDNRRAVLAGTRSFGKGSVQTIMPLGKDSGALRLTTAKYFLPSGKTIHKKGITPDIIIPLTHAEQFELASLSPGRMMRSEEEMKKTVQKDRQLQRALDILHGIVIMQK